MLDLGVTRIGGEQTLGVTLGKAPAPQRTDDVAATAEPIKLPRSANDLGLMMAPAAEASVNKMADAPKEKKGVVILGIDPVGRAARLGIDPGDVILDVAGQAVQTPQEVHKALEDAHNAGRTATLMRVKSAETIRLVRCHSIRRDSSKTALVASLGTVSYVSPCTRAVLTHDKALFEMADASSISS